MTSFGACAFCECSQLTEITVPDTVDRIGASAFCWCSALSSVTLPDHLTSLGCDAFRSCYELISLTLPEGLTAIEPFTFVGCSALTSVTIPEGVAVIGCSAFEHCSDLASVSLPESVTCIGEYAFAGCRGLSSVKLPAGISRIETGAFENCPKLDMLVIRNADCLAGFMSENYSPDDTEEDMNDFSDETLGEHRTVIYGRHDQARLDSGDIAERYRYAEAYAVNYGYTFYRGLGLQERDHRRHRRRALLPRQHLHQRADCDLPLEGRRLPRTGDHGESLPGREGEQILLQGGSVGPGK